MPDFPHLPPEGSFVMNIWQVFSRLPAAVAALQDLAGRILALHSDPAVVAALAADPALKAQADAISSDVRSLQEAFK